METADRIIWREPFRATQRDSLQQLRDTGILRLGFWIRNLLMAGIPIAFFIFWMMWAYPRIILPWPQIWVGFVGAPLLMLFLAAIVICCPRFIEVRYEWLQISHGSSVVRITPQQIDRIELEIVETDEPRLVVGYRTRRGKNIKGNYVVAASVDLKELLDFVDYLRMRAEVDVIEAVLVDSATGVPARSS